MSTTSYITTPIYYVNDKPHIGHAYTTTLCDVWARAMRFLGREVFFLTGTDEHGIKVEQSAADRGISPRALADENAAEFRRVLRTFGLTNDDFIRTTEPRHERRVQAFVQRLIETGDVYLGTFEGWYDEGQEEYYTETKAKALDYKSPVSGKPLARATEENYYFRLSRYQGFLEMLFNEEPEFVRPTARRNEVIGRLREGLQDVPITRTNFTWGIPMPGAAEHVIYVWIDALLNYITALELDDPAKGRAKFWPATYHVIGKEILWFHAVIWPALLRACDLPLPRCVYAHSFWIAEGQKMSKTLGNFIDLPTIQRYLDTYSLDAWRWYMTTQGPLEATDADFSAKHFHEIYTADLVNTFANCASRVSAMIGKYFEGKLPPAGADERLARLRGESAERLEKVLGGLYERFELREAGRTGLEIARLVDEIVNETQPFKLAKDPARLPEVGAILHGCAEGIVRSALALYPIMPTKCEELLAAFGTRAADWRGEAWRNLRLEEGASIAKCALFMRMDPVPAS